jgi:MFS transporter, DHA2 family, multidrug resistance protein
MSGPATPPVGAAPPPAQAIPWFGLTAVLLGTFISTLNGRLSTFGLNDIRGGVHAGFDDGAWITTAQTVAQMLILPGAVWLGFVFGPRRVLIQAALAYAVISFVEPFSSNLTMLLALQFMGGLASGFFIPLTLAFILRRTPPRFWAYGIALYALNLELSLNISASLEGWYVEHLSWRWIFWQNVPLALGMFACFKWASKSEPPNPAPPMPDRFGLVTSGVGLALIYAALDQGNRLDWLNSGLIVGLLAAGVILVAGFIEHERRSPQPFINLKVVVSPPMLRLLAGVAFLRLTILSTAYLIPQFLGAVRSFRALEVGQTMIWIAAPQLITCALAAVMLRRIDPRLVASLGFILISVACLIVAHGLTPVWGSDQFMVSQLLQAVGQSFALSGVVFYGILHMKPEEALTFGAALQTSRLMGGQIGAAFIATFVRIRSQIASNHIGLHVRVGDSQVLHRLQDYATVTGQAVDPATATERAVAVLAGGVRSAAATQGVIDGFMAIGALTALALLVVVVAQKPAPIGPASHLPLFTPRPEPTPAPDLGARPS